MSETKGARRKIDQMTGNLVRSGSSPDYARAVTLDAARRADRGAVTKRARVDVSPVEGKPGRFLIHFLGTRGKTPLVSFEAGKFGGSVGVTLILDNRGAAV